jgi:SAM-dependent methyltransferase
VTPPRFQLPPRGALTANNAVDPFRFYYRPLIGRVFAARLDVGLGLVDGRFRRLLEIGYGSGLLMPTLAGLTDELYGADLETEPPGLRAALAGLGVRPAGLVQADVQNLPFPDEKFDGVVAFSILEHLKRDELERALGEVARVLEPGGRFLVGCPAVHRAMNAAFAAIGFRGIEQHHFSGMPDVLRAAAPWFTVEKRATLPRLLDRLGAPLGWAPYTAVLLGKR